MTVARGTTYDLKDAWDRFLQFYGNLIEHNIGMLVFGLGGRAAVGSICGRRAARRSWPC